MMNKLKSIIEGWRNASKDRKGQLPPELKELYDFRLETCKSNECGKLKYAICTACGCPVKKKTKSLREQCPENMWKPIVYSIIEPNVFIDIMEIPPLLRKMFCEFYQTEILKQELMDGFTMSTAPLSAWEAFLDFLQGD
jgi:hypothetical protein